jgi:hypothetical protein
VYCKSYIQRDVDELSSYNKKQHKYHAINLLHKHTVEVRGFRPQPSARVLLREMQLLEGRLNKLRGQPLIGYNPQVCTSEEHPVHFFEVIRCIESKSCNMVREFASEFVASGVLVGRSSHGILLCRHRQGDEFPEVEHLLVMLSSHGFCFADLLKFQESIQQSLRDYVNDAGLDSADFPFDQIFL